ncbi:helix-turn-helix transcriptional regulator [Sphingobacterium sp. UGAL515B_05]|uniref:helix-turn-helix domain-containing protein n=1 Tax=Sphingobacterium sp. UGAL515B_05 TaxID=2986767 RepID=UPI002954C391|nr:helix-turn-helix transcriptional regulator [Sphingobacterium sp. UGAL515B_05]WON93774.1 helix-turn-helix domain-containing protein [Sphingobacterium sp. UGAL515B_05]
MNINQLTASKIKDLRTKNGLTAEAVAQALQISRGAYSQLENGHVEITLSRVELLSQIFNVTLGEIIPSSTTYHQSYNHNKGGVNGNHNNNNTKTMNNFFADDENISRVIEVIKDALQNEGK